ncbi:ribosome 60S biogenesis N-terminal-domain-containing protein [Mycena floridula]|nr:ribosome 60S biogenesis N-terminal-domain-containing protein [Mycena floridula]
MPEARRPTVNFSNVAEIQNGLGNQNSQETLTKTLTVLRNQLSVHPHETDIPPSDKRLILLQKWLQKSPAAQDIFGVWEIAGQGQTVLLSLIVTVLSSVLNLLSNHYTFHAFGYPIIKSLLSPQWLRKLNSYLGGSHNDLILATLKLFNSMSSFASGRERKHVLQSFGWEIKSLPRLLNMRRKKVDDALDPLTRPDIRTLYVLFLLSFVDTGSTAQVKLTFLEQHRDKFIALFKGIAADPYSVARKILETCWAGIWSDSKIKRTIKLGLFNEITIAQIGKLYERADPEDDEDDHIPADLAHHFLLAICTRPGTGICFQDRGWYPRVPSVDEVVEDKEVEGPQSKFGKLHNKILANVLKSLKANEDLRQQELALRIMTACPELVAGYWTAVALTLEPRLSSKWLANISLFGLIISLPVPKSSLFLPDKDQPLYNPSPPPVTAIMENILPSVNMKSNLSKGIQASQGLVQHCTALALVKCLIKYHQVVSLFRSVSVVLEENQEDGQWSTRVRELEREMRKRVPEFQVIIAFSQRKEDVKAPNPSRTALLAEVANRLLWLYHCCLPEAVAEARFDVGKVLNEPLQSPEVQISTQLGAVSQLHVYRLLQASEQFVWTVKPPNSKLTYVGLLMKAYGVATNPATRAILSSLLQHLFSSSILFQDNPQEPELWLDCLPSTKRGPTSISPDDAPLADELESVVIFLDDCIQRCLKTPYRYIEAMEATKSTTEAAVDSIPSSLLMTVLEQLNIKVTNQLLTPSDVLALATFIRLLFLKLSTELSNLDILKTLADRILAVLDVDSLFPQYPHIRAATRHEMQTIRRYLNLRPGAVDKPGPAGRDVADFIAEIEAIPNPTEASVKVNLAYELVDWLRLVNQPLGVPEALRITAMVSLLHPPALKTLCQSLGPSPSLIWEGAGLLARPDVIALHLDFDWLYTNTQPDQLRDESCIRILQQTIFCRKPTLAFLKRTMRLVTRSLTNMDDKAIPDLILFIGSVFQRSRSVISPQEIKTLKDFVFIQCNPIKRLCMSASCPRPTEEAIARIVKSIFYTDNVDDNQTILEIAQHWQNTIKGDASFKHGPLASCWIQYMPAELLLELLDICDERLKSHSAELTSMLLADICSALSRASGISDSSGIVRAFLRDRLDRLVAIRSHHPNITTLEGMISVALDSGLPACIDGSVTMESASLASITAASDLRWQRRLQSLPLELHLTTFLEQDDWCDATVKIIERILYSGSFQHAVFTSWLQSGRCSTHSVPYLASIMHAYLDVTHLQNRETSPEEIECWMPHLPFFLRNLTDTQQAVQVRSHCASCILLLCSSVPTKRKSLIKSIVAHIQSLPVSRLTNELLTLALRLTPNDATPILDELSHHGLQWAVGHLDDAAETRKLIIKLQHVLEASSSLKAHFVEPFLTSVLQNHLSNPDALELVSVALQKSQLKPLVVNRHLQSVIQHPNFLKVCSEKSRSRDACVKALYRFFFLHPMNTCQITHVEPLISLYHGTVSISDRMLLSIFRLFERQRKTSIGALFDQWSPAADVPRHSALEAIQHLDPSTVFRTFLHFPQWRTLEDQTSGWRQPLEPQMYDPVFLILLFGHALSETVPETAVGWVELFRTNIVSLFVRGLSSKDDGVRQLALSQLTVLWAHLENADMQEQPYVVYILSLLKDAIPSTLGDSVIRLPSYATLILAHALRGVFYPSSFIYPLTARFLLQRPTLDTTDVPMLYNMLYSSSDDWKKERAWIIRFLADGLVSTDDWRVFKRRHTWDLLASMFQSFRNDLPLRRGILEVLANLSCIRQATTSLVLKSALLSWLEMQFLTPMHHELVAWLKIIENIISVLDPAKMEVSTNGEWRALISRCLLSLLQNWVPAAPDASSVLVLAARVVCRLSALPGAPSSALPALLDQAVHCLIQAESIQKVDSSSGIESRSKGAKLPPHNAHGLHEIQDSNEPLVNWGETVESLWQVAMKSEHKSSAWDTLTNRMLIWRGFVGEEETPLGEWVRKEVLASLVS